MRIDFCGHAGRLSLGVVFVVLFLLPAAVGAQNSTDFFTVPPCRLYDSRWGEGPLVGGFDRWVPAGGYCGIPPDATAATLNITAVTPTDDGLLSVYPCCSPSNNIVVGVQSGKNLAGVAILSLGQDGKLDAFLNATYQTAAHLVVDVSGYFRPVSEVQQWREWEGSLTSPQDFTTNGGDPYAEVAVDVRFTNAATGQTFVQPAVWDGDELSPKSFKIWMALPTGTWTWAVDSCTRSGSNCLSGWLPSQGTIIVQSNTASGNPLYDRGFIEQVETVVGGQTVAWSELKYPDGLSFTWVGDTTWVAPVREFDPDGTGPKTAQTSSWDAYLADRKSKGFTAVQIAPAIAWSLGGQLQPLPAAKDFSFKKKAACSDATADATPIPNQSCWQVKGGKGEYWRHFKQMVQKANNSGLLVAVVGVMNPTGIGTNKEYRHKCEGVRALSQGLAGRSERHLFTGLRRRRGRDRSQDSAAAVRADERGRQRAQGQDSVRQAAAGDQPSGERQEQL